MVALRAALPWGIESRRTQPTPSCAESWPLRFPAWAFLDGRRLIFALAFVCGAALLGYQIGKVLTEFAPVHTGSLLTAADGSIGLDSGTTEVNGLERGIYQTEPLSAARKLPFRLVDSYRCFPISFRSGSLFGHVQGRRMTAGTRQRSRAV